MATPSTITSSPKHAEQTTLRSVPSNLSETLPPRPAPRQEHDQTVGEAFSIHKKAVVWALGVSLCLALKGYSVSQGNSFFLDNQFVAAFGGTGADGITKSITPGVQAAINFSTTGGEIIGSLLSSALADALGYRLTLALALVLQLVFIAIAYTANVSTQLVVANLLMGLCYGILHVVALAYIVDISPKALRAHLTAACNLSWGLGSVIGMGVIWSASPLPGTIPTQSTFRIPFAVAWIWPAPLLAVVLLAPESPWWLVRRGKPDAARRALTRLVSSSSSSLADAHLATITRTLDAEAVLRSGQRSYAALFFKKGPAARRTWLTVGVLSLPALAGSDYGAYGPFFLWMGGFAFNSSKQFGIGQHGLTMLAFLAVTLPLLTFVGRRRAIVLAGLAPLPFLMLCVACIGYAPKELKYTKAGYASGILLIFWWAIFSSTVAPLSFTLAAEIPARSALVRSLALGRAVASAVTAVCIMLTGAMVNPANLDWGNFTGFFWLGLSSICILWAFFFLPETRAREFKELDALFERRVAARRFGAARVEALPDAVHGQELDSRDNKAAAGYGSRV